MRAIILAMLALSTSAIAEDIRILHFNIRELTSGKIRGTGPQITAVQEILDRPFDLLSIQEMQYDLPQVPDATFTTEGKNMAALLRLIGADPESFHISFAPANTGRNARKRPDGNYYPDTSDPDSRNFADPVNFGVHPGQYSSALASRYPIIRQTVISDLPWAQFNSSIDLSPFRTKEGHPLPARIQLFDKNFTHLVVEMAGRPVHVVFFHAVPPFHFGNQHTPNYQRNRDQLRFLEWYLTGETDIPIHLPQLKPIAGEPLIAMGDWNVDHKDHSKPGTAVLNRIFAKLHNAMDSHPPTYPKLELSIDHIVFSDHFTLLDSRVLNQDVATAEAASDHLAVTARLRTRWVADH